MPGAKPGVKVGWIHLYKCSRLDYTAKFITKSTASLHLERMYLCLCCLPWRTGGTFNRLEYVGCILPDVHGEVSDIEYMSHGVAIGRAYSLITAVLREAMVPQSCMCLFVTTINFDRVSRDTACHQTQSHIIRLKAATSASVPPV